MDSGLALGIVTAMAAVLGSLVAWLAWRETHRDTVQKTDAEKIKQIIQAELAPLTQQIHDLTVQLQATNARQDAQQRDIHELTDKLGKVLDRLAVIETKVEVFWKSVAMDAAKIIHSPDPRRRQVDELIEAFQHAADGQGMMSSNDYNKLREILLFMRDWEPGMESDFPIYPGEQFAAAVLLRTMDHALASTKRSKG